MAQTNTIEETWSKYSPFSFLFFSTVDLQHPQLRVEKKPKQQLTQVHLEKSC